MAATVALVRLFGQTIPVPAEVNIQLDSFKETAEEEEDNDDNSAKDNPEHTDGGKKRKLPKPEKILPCPRCSSMATKFCYYNNYNLNQPRHFCKNCQRYWTAGGSMRNVPVGAGRRRSKNSGAGYRHVTILNPQNSSSGDGYFHVNPLSYYPMAGFLSFPSTPPPETAETERRLWFPKTLRIGDPVEAAKSSIWATMGFSKETAGRGGLFHGFELGKKRQQTIGRDDGSRVAHDNPAAASRSFSFQRNALP